MWQNEASNAANAIIAPELESLESSMIYYMLHTHIHVSAVELIVRAYEKGLAKVTLSQSNTNCSFTALLAL